MEHPLPQGSIKKLNGDTFTPEDLDKTINQWRVGIHRKSEQFESGVHIAILGGSSSGKKSCINSIFHALYPELVRRAEWKVASVSVENIPKSFRLTNRITVWKIPSFSEDLKQIKTLLEESGTKMPKFNTFCIVINPEDLKRPKYLEEVKKVIALGCKNGIPSVLYVTKVDVVSAYDMASLFENLASKLGVQREFLLPFKNLVNDDDSSLLDYFTLRILDKTLACVSSTF